MRTSLARIFAELTPNRHTTGAFARDINGSNVPANDCGAVKWCAMGWVEYRYPNNAHQITSKISWEITYWPIGHENDERGYEFIKFLQSLDDE
ncbi:MAG: hypothetical protein L0287_24770, partial [Anaerolineae bacterium]|nr:hypothetical protein [Anaerolineae bacterium]